LVPARNFAYIYRGTIIHHLDWGEHGLAYYIPALLWAHEVTGKENTCVRTINFTRITVQPEQTLRYDPQNPFVWTQSAFKWSMWIPWLCQHAPNAKYYQLLFPQIVDLVHDDLNQLPAGGPWP